MLKFSRRIFARALKGILGAAVALALAFVPTAVSAYQEQNLMLFLDYNNTNSYNWWSNAYLWGDLSPNNRDGTIIGTPTFSEGLAFSGGTYVDMGDGFSNFGSGITIEFEAHFGSGIQNWERIFDFGNGQGQDNIWVGSYWNTDEIALEIWRLENGVQVPKGRCKSSDEVNALQANTFKKFVITLNGGWCNMYINGSEVNTAVDGPAKSAYTGTSNFDVFYDSAWLASPYPSLPRDVYRTSNYVAKSNWGADAPFEGQIKYLRLYSEALSASAAINNSSTFTVTYSSTGSTSGSPPSAYTGSGQITLPGASSLVKTGHNFVGWSTSVNQTTAISNTYNISANVTLYPAFAPYSYNVTYDEHGGSTVSDGTFTYGGSLTYPANPTRAGYTFQGWFANATGGSALTASSVAAGNTSTTLHAQWSPNTYNVTYDEHGGSAVSDGSYVFGNTLVFPTSPTKAGNTFQGWFAAASGGTARTAAQVSAGTSDVTLHAQWVPNTYNVTYDEHGGSTVADGSFTHDGSLIFPSNPTRAGYTFQGWFASSSGGAALTAANVAADNASTTLHAQWSPNTYNVTYDEHGGSAVSDASYVFGSGLTFPVPVWTGYTFQGWFAAASGGSALTEAGVAAGTSDVTLHAQWVISTYTVSYDEHGGSTVSDGSYTHGGSLSFPGNPTRAGYTFQGWFAAPSGGTALSASAVAAMNSTTTVHAQWTPNTYNVTYDEHGGSSVSDGSYVFGTTLGFPAAPTRTGYGFQGWFASASGGSALSAAAVSAGTSDVTLHAQWLQLVSQTVTWAPTNTSVSSQLGTITPSSSATTSGTGTISYGVISRGALGCSVDPNTGVISFIGVGTCTVRASASESSTHLAAHTDVVFTSTSNAPAFSLNLNMTVGQSVANSTLDYAASGLNPNTSWDLVLRSTPQTLASGVFSGSVLSGSATIPSGLQPGWHSLTLTGTGPNGSIASHTVWFEVSANGTLAGTSSVNPVVASSTSLAQTGTDILGKMSAAVLLVLLGAVLVSLTRLRRELS